MTKGYAYETKKPVASVTVRVRAAPIRARCATAHEGVVINSNDCILEATAHALKEFPLFNSDMVETLHQRPSVDLGYFINVNHGPRLAVIAHAETRSITDIAKVVRQQTLQYMRGELVDETTASFSITNLALFNAWHASPPLLVGQSAILAIASEREEVVWKDSSPQPETAFIMTLVYDSRIADCQLALRFLNTIRSRLER